MSSQTTTVFLLSPIEIPAGCNVEMSWHVPLVNYNTLTKGASVKFMFS